MGRVADFVDQLFGDSSPRDGAAGAVRFRDRRSAVVGKFGNRIADIRQIERLPMPIQAAGGLCATFDQMPGDAGPGQTIPIVPRPAEFESRRPDRQRCIRHAAGNNNPRAAASASAIGAAPR